MPSLFVSLAVSTTWLLGPPLPVGQSQDTARLAVELVTARFVASQHPGRRLGLMAGAQEIVERARPTGKAQAGYRTKEHVLGMAHAAEAIVLTTYAGRFCTAQMAEGCVEIAFRIGVPEINGDTAEVWTYAYESPRSGAWREEVDERLRLVKMRNGWRVDARIETRRAYARRDNPLVMPPEAGH
jgi:hypothetical protein